MKPDDTFIADLDKSRVRVERFAAQHRARGIDIWQHPAVTRPDSSVRRDYADKGDLLIMVRVEHKSRDFDFTCAADFPYPTIIVDEVYKIDRQQRPFEYVIENASGTRAVRISYRTMPAWTKSRRFDPSQGRECDFYEAPLEVVVFCDAGEVY